MITGLIGKKIGHTQDFLEDGKRVPVSRVLVSPNIITQLKTEEKDGYNAIQFGIDSMKKANKPQTEHAKRAGLTKTPRFLKEIRVEKHDESLSQNAQVKAEEVLQAGDLIDVTGISKGKGFAGVVKRHHFKGGPRTHGQSDRERAPGSIGQTTTPGRVYKGKRMAGKMGNKRRTVKNLVVLNVEEDIVSIKGLVPGIPDSVLLIKKVGQDKKFVPLFRKQEIVIAEEKSKPEEKEAVQKEAKEEKVEAKADAKIETVDTKSEEKNEVKEEVKNG